MRYWGVTEAGNFEGKNILNVPQPPEAVAEEFGLTPDELEERIEKARIKLFDVRERRIRPGLDDKVLSAWNGLMLRSFALAARVLDRDDYRAVAEKNAAFLLEKLKSGGRLRRSYKDGRARFNGYLEDYAMVADGPRGALRGGPSIRAGFQRPTSCATPCSNFSGTPVAGPSTTPPPTTRSW